MDGNKGTGFTLCVAMSVYFVAKAVLNMILGGGFSLGDLLIAAGLSAALFTGMQFINYAVAAVLAIIVATHLGYNLTNLPGTLVYLIEALVDAGCILLLIFSSDVKENFTKKWQELFK